MQFRDTEPLDALQQTGNFILSHDIRRDPPRHGDGAEVDQS